MRFTLYKLMPEEYTNVILIRLSAIMMSLSAACASFPVMSFCLAFGDSEEVFPRETEQNPVITSAVYIADIIDPLESSELTANDGICLPTRVQTPVAQLRSCLGTA